MHLGTIRDGAGTAAVAVSDGVMRRLPYTDVRDYLVGGAPTLELDDLPAVPDGGRAEWAPPVVEPAKIICVGLNFYGHIREMGREIPRYPTLFAKFARALIGATDPIVLPRDSQCVDWEAELALVIRHQLRDADREEAQEAIAGFTVMNDISVRDYQHRTTQWLQGKTFESTTPLGPVVVPGDEVGWGRDLSIRCCVDGEVVQELSTSDMVFDAIDVVSYVSRIVTLDPGDVLSLGTGAGVGAGRQPPQYLLSGQVVETTIPGIGSLVNKCMQAVA